jgi:type I restriction-modification system DNA methylase subunit
MGQYFTERSLMLMSLHLVDREDIDEFGINNDSTMGDEYCGTFGFPLKAREFFAKHYGIVFKPENIYGVEYKPETFCFASANAMLSGNGTNSYKLTHGSSFVTNMTPHLDFSVHNVPFGNTMRWKDIIAYARDEETKALLTKNIEVKVNVDAVLCAQLVVYKTRKMGILIIKDGKETSSPKFEAFRRSIMDKCIVKKIMKIPNTAFTHTNTKTICIYFTKPLDGRKTGSIQFCQLNDSLDTIHEICQVSREDLDARACSWNPQDYLVDEKTEYMKGKSVCEWKTLCDVASFKSGKMLSRKICVSGIYYVIGGGQKPSCMHNEFNMDANTILCSKSGEYSGYISKYNTPVWASDCFSIISNTNTINRYWWRCCNLLFKC